MNNFQLLAVDLDGTLLNDENKISNENLQAIRELNKRNIVFAPCTGRTLSEIPNLIKDNEDIRYIVYSNGSVVFDKVSKRTIKCCISNETALKIYNILSKYQVHFTIRVDGKCYIEKNSTDDFNISYYNIIPAHEDVLKNYSIEVDDFSSWKSNLEDVEVVSVFFHSDKDLVECKSKLSAISEIMFVQAAEYNLEILSKNAGKGTGLINLSKMLNIEKEKVVAVGDSGNDIPMMSGAGISVAVSNATDTLKAVCDRVICSNNEHVVEYILKNF